MKPEYWSKLVENVDQMVTLLLAHKDMVLSESITEDMEQLVTPPYQVRGCLLTALERLDDEFTKLLKECDPHSNEYVERLKDEVRVSALIDRVCEVVERNGTPQVSFSSSCTNLSEVLFLSKLCVVEKIVSHLITCLNRQVYFRNFSTS